MTVIDLYSKRQKRLKGEQSDVYIYDEMPQRFREQARQIIAEAFHQDVRNDAFGDEFGIEALKERGLYEEVVLNLRREHGISHLPKENFAYCDYSFQEELFVFL